MGKREKMPKVEPEYESHSIMITPEMWLWLERQRRKKGQRSISEALREILREAMENE